LSVECYICSNVNLPDGVDNFGEKVDWQNPKGGKRDVEHGEDGGAQVLATGLSEREHD